MSRPPVRRRRQAGQAIVIIAFMVVALTAAVGLAIDAGIGYVYNAQAERAAAAAALSGVVMMPDQFTPAQAVPPLSGNDATDRAYNEARRNGFDVNDVANVTVTPEAVPGFDNKFRVTVCRIVGTTFMKLFGVSSFQVCRKATAAYLPPLQIGQPGSHLGATVSTLGGSDYFFLRTMGYGADRGDGDAFTPQTCIDQGINYQPTCSTDVHGIAYAASPSTEPRWDVQTPGLLPLPDRGGYNFRVYLPYGGTIQVYNSIFAPSFSAQDYCENAIAPSSFAGCNPLNGPYYLHEDDSWVGIGATQGSYSAMRYTVFRVPNKFNRFEDLPQTQLTIRPVEASNRVTLNQYRDANNSTIITQLFDGGGNPTNMQAYHNWIDTANVSPNAAGDSSDPSLVSYTTGFGPYGGALPAGSYRLRVDTLEYDGSLPPPNGATGTAVAHKAFALRVTDSLGGDCTTTVPACAVGAWNDMCIYTPAQTGTFSLPFLSIPADYAGQPITLQYFDVGDSSGTVTLSVLDPTTSPPYQTFNSTLPRTVDIYNRGVDRTTIPPGTNNLISGAGNTAASYQPTVANTAYYDGYWVQMTLPLPSTYNPGANPWWKMRYDTTGGAYDTFTIAVNFKGNPAHILDS